MPIKPFWDFLLPKQKTEKRKKIQARLDAKFQANCHSTATSVQVLDVKDIAITARGDCTVTFANKSTVDSQCDMKPIIKSISDSLVATDKELAKLLAGEDNTIAGTKSDSDLKINIRRNLEMKCDSHSKARQTLKVTGVNIYCDQAAGVEYKNSSEIRATCLKEILNDALERQDKFETDSDSDSEEDDDDKDVTAQAIIGIVGLLFFVVILKKMNREKK